MKITNKLNKKVIKNLIKENNLLKKALKDLEFKRTPKNLREFTYYSDDKVLNYEKLIIAHQKLKEEKEYILKGMEGHIDRINMKHDKEIKAIHVQFSKLVGRLEKEAKFIKVYSEHNGFWHII